MSETLKGKTAKGLIWGAVNSGVTQVLSLLIGIFLARKLSLADYGIVGMLAIFTAIATNVQDCGFANALINKKGTNDRDYNAVFWFNVIASVSMYVILFFSAPFIATFFRQPVLEPLSHLLFLNFLITSLGIVHNAYLTKNLMNKEKAIIAIAAVVLSGISSITLAYLGFSYWSLAWQQIIYNAVTLIGRYYYSAWRPSLHIDLKPVKEMFGFSSKILITTLVNTANQNVLTLLIGRFYSVHSLGNYTQAAKWEGMAHGFMNMTIAQVAQSVLASLNDDLDRQRRAFRKMLRFTAFLSFPIMLGLALVSREFIVITITEKWIGAVPMLQVLCLSGAFAPFYVLYQYLAISKGKSDTFMWCSLAQMVLQTMIVLLFCLQDIISMVLAFSAFNIVWLLVWHSLVGSMIDLRLKDALFDTMPFFFAALTVIAVTYFLTNSLESPELSLLLRVTIAVILYVSLMKVFHVAIMDEAFHYLFGKKARGTDSCKQP